MKISESTCKVWGPGLCAQEALDKREVSFIAVAVSGESPALRCGLLPVLGFRVQASQPFSSLLWSTVGGLGAHHPRKIRCSSRWEVLADPGLSPCSVVCCDPGRVPSPPGSPLPNLRNENDRCWGHNIMVNAAHVTGPQEMFPLILQGKGHSETWRVPQNPVDKERMMHSCSLFLAAAPQVQPSSLTFLCSSFCSF